MPYFFHSSFPLCYQKKVVGKEGGENIRFLKFVIFFFRGGCV